MGHHCHPASRKTFVSLWNIHLVAQTISKTIICLVFRFPVRNFTWQESLPEAAAQILLLFIFSILKRYCLLQSTLSRTVTVALSNLFGILSESVKYYGIYNLSNYIKEFIQMWMHVTCITYQTLWFPIQQWQRNFLRKFWSLMLED